MSELITTVSAFPEFWGREEEIEIWHRQAAEAVEAWGFLEAGEGYSYTSPLPWLVGWIPEEERSYFDELPDAEDKPDSNERWLPYSVNGLPTELSVTKAVIKHDLHLLYGGRRRNMTGRDLELTHTLPGNSPRENLPHFDGTLTSRADSVTYLVTNRLGTPFYGGPARLSPPEKKYFKSRDCLDQASLDPTGPWISAPPYGIVRMPPLSIHTSPTAEKPTTRTFMRLSYSLE